MYQTQSKREFAIEFQPQIHILRPSIHSRRANLVVKFQDLYGFTVEGNVDDVNILNEVREKVRQQGRVWWALEASKGANWYLQPQVSSLTEGIALKSSLKLSTLANAITLKRLIRKGIPPVLRPKVWFSLSGAAKKKSTVPESYYNDMTKAVEGKVTAATKQIDHVSLNLCYLAICQSGFFYNWDWFSAFILIEKLWGLVLLRSLDDGLGRLLLSLIVKI